MTDTARPKVLCIIPARGGSKGLPRKNIAPLGGVPLIAWSIAAAKQCPAVAEVVVSTDDEEIAQIAKQWGALVPFLRPKELADDNSLVGDAVSHTLSNLQQEYDVIVMLYPTQPFRTPALIGDVIHTVTSKVLGLTSATLESNLPGDFVFFGEGEPVPLASRLRLPILRRLGLISASTMYPKSVYREKGVEFYAAIVDAVRKGDARWLSIDYYIDFFDPAFLVDIDSEADLRAAQELLDSGAVPWSPSNGYQAANSDKRHLLANYISPGFKVYAPGNGQRGELSIPANPLSLTPLAVREALNELAGFANEDAIVFVGDAADLDVSEEAENFRNPKILARKECQLSLGAGLRFGVTAYSLLFFEPSLIARFGCAIGDVDAKLSDGKTVVDLSKVGGPGKYLVLRAYDAGAGVQSLSPLYRWEQGTWIVNDARSAEAFDDAIEIFGEGEQWVVRHPEGAITASFLVLDPQEWDPKAGHYWQPLEFSGIFEFDHKNRFYTNMLTGKSISRRQDMPPVFRWSGVVYVPKDVTTDSQWSVSWQ